MPTDAGAWPYCVVADTYISAVPGRGRPRGRCRARRAPGRTVRVQWDERLPGRARVEPAWVIVNVFGPPWVAGLPAGTSGPHGDLGPRGAPGKPYHSVLIVAWEGDSFFVLDPFYSNANQPFEVSDDEFLASLMGLALVVSTRVD